MVEGGGEAGGLDEVRVVRVVVFWKGERAHSEARVNVDDEEADRGEFEEGGGVVAGCESDEVVSFWV